MWKVYGAMYALEFACPRRHSFRKHFESLKDARELRKTGSHFLCPHCGSSVYADPGQVIYGDNGQDAGDAPIWSPAPGPLQPIPPVSTPSPPPPGSIHIGGTRIGSEPVDVLKIQKEINEKTESDVTPITPPAPNPTAWVSKELNYDAELLIKHVDWAVEQSRLERSNTSVLGIEGMSSKRVRCLLNNLNSLPGARYLEIGIHQGSTFIPAVSNNPHLVAVAIDNWSTHGENGSREAFHRNLKNHDLEGKHTIIDRNCFGLKPEDIDKVHDINVYFYDGNHEHGDQSNALTYYINRLTETFIYICDDWNHQPSKTGTQEAEEKLNLKVCKKWELNDGYWNGILVAVYQKPSK